jgi:YhcH/YjgK/YiaL family protein
MTLQTISKPYEEETDFMLVADPPSFFANLTEGSFMIFYPTDLHMPCIKINEPAMVKKLVVKVRI